MKMCWLIRRGLVAYQDGTLGQRRAQRVARHLHTCPSLPTRASGTAAGDASPALPSRSFTTICILARSAPAAAGEDSATAAQSQSDLAGSTTSRAHQNTQRKRSFLSPLSAWHSSVPSHSSVWRTKRSSFSPPTSCPSCCSKGRQHCASGRLADTQRIGHPSGGGPGSAPDGAPIHPFPGPGNDQLLLEHAPGQRDPSSPSNRRTRLLAGKLSGEPGTHGLDRPR